MINKIARSFLCLAMIFNFLFFSNAVMLNAQEGIVVEEQEADQGASPAEELMSLDFESTEIRDVIRVLAHKSGMNMIVGQDVKASVTLQVKDVTWQQALDVILKTYNLAAKKEGNLMRIMTYDQMRLEDEKIPLTTRIITLDFANVEEIKTSLSSNLSSRGSMEANQRTNSIIITDLPDRIAEIERLTAKLDTRTPQILIEALIADVELDSDWRKGFQWTFDGPISDKSTAGGEELGREFTYYQPLTAATTAASIAFGQSIFERWDLEGLVNMWQSDSRVNILANPRVMTLDNITAQIELIQQIPYTQQTESGQGAPIATTSFKDAGIKLYVTPHVTTKEGFISMNLKVEHSFQSGTTGDNQPVIDSRKAETNLMVRDGETIVIGGLRNKEDHIQYDKVPLLGDLPFIGVFFQKQLKTVEDTDLMIFVTPKMVVDSALTSKEKDRFDLFTEKKEEESSIALASPEDAELKRIEQERIEQLRKEEGMPPSAVKAYPPDETALSHKKAPFLKEKTFDLRPPK
ncbi:type IV pilus secretin PilQ [Candidatus Omnitrophota bacterium]